MQPSGYHWIPETGETHMPSTDSVKQDGVVASKGSGHGIGVLQPESGANVDVREQKGHCASRHLSYRLLPQGTS